MRERMVEEMEVVRLRMIRHSDMPDMVTSITSQYSTPEYEDGPPSVIANELPYPDPNTVKAMLNRERELKSYNQTQRAYALSLGKNPETTCTVRWVNKVIQGPIVQSWIKAIPGLKFDPVF